MEKNTNRGDIDCPGDRDVEILNRVARELVKFGVKNFRTRGSYQGPSWENQCRQ